MLGAVNGSTALGAAAFEVASAANGVAGESGRAPASTAGSAAGASPPSQPTSSAARPSSGGAPLLREHVSIAESLAREVIRKLRLATEAETKEDRDIVCEEVCGAMQFSTLDMAFPVLRAGAGAERGEPYNPGPERIVAGQGRHPAENLPKSIRVVVVV